MMRQLVTLSTLLLSLLLQGTLCLAESPAEEPTAKQLPDWQVLEFEEKAFWATAQSRLELLPAEGNPDHWSFVANSSVPNNSEQVSMTLNAQTGQILQRERLSYGKKDQRVKSYRYGSKYVFKERREPSNSAATTSPGEWPLVSKGKLLRPASDKNLVITNPYLLILHAAELQKEGLDSKRELMVHTDENFYVARLSSGKGIPLEADFQVVGGKSIKEQRETIGVVIKVSPAENLKDKDDFSLLGLSGDIIILFDKETGLPLQIRGLAPRIGSANINLKSVTMRPPAE
jgi:hypothetical protein